MTAITRFFAKFNTTQRFPMNINLNKWDFLEGEKLFKQPNGASKVRESYLILQLSSNTGN